MSVYQVKQGINIFKDNFEIKKDGEVVYNVKGEAVSWGDKLSFKNKEGEELAYIKQTKVATLAYPKYEIIRDGETWAELTKDSGLGAATKNVTMKIPGPNDYVIIGTDFLAWHFKIERTSGALAATVDKKWGITDTYGVKVEEGEDDVAILLATVVIDQMFHDKDDR